MVERSVVQLIAEGVNGMLADKAGGTAGTANLVRHQHLRARRFEGVICHHVLVDGGCSRVKLSGIVQVEFVVPQSICCD